MNYLECASLEMPRSAKLTSWNLVKEFDPLYWFSRAGSMEMHYHERFNVTLGTVSSPHSKMRMAWLLFNIRKHPVGDELKYTNRPAPLYAVRVRSDLPKFDGWDETFQMKSPDL